MTDKKISELTSTGTANSTALIPVAIAGSNLAYTAQAIANLATGGITPQSISAANDTNVTLALSGNTDSALVNSVTITAGWTGTLSSARQPATTVNSVINDSNVTGSIATQVLSLGWTGVLNAARGGTSQSAYVKGDLLVGSGASGLFKLGSGSDNMVLTADAAQTLGVKWASVSGGTGTPGGSATQVQFNDGGTGFGGDSGLTFNSTSNLLTVTAASNVGNTALQVLPSTGASFTKINDNGTMVIDADSGTGTTPLALKYNGTQLFSFGFDGTAAVGDVGQTKGNVNVGQGRVVVDYIGTIRMFEITAPAGNANEARLFAVDSGGKTVLKVIFGSGAAQVIASEP